MSQIKQHNFVNEVSKANAEKTASEVGLSSDKADTATHGTHETLSDINRRTGRNMPQAVATAAILVVAIVSCLIISIDVFIVLMAIFMVLALWELHVDFATLGLRIPFVTLSICSLVTIFATYYAKWHAVAMASGITASLLLTVICATLSSTISDRTMQAVEKSSMVLTAHHTNILYLRIRLFRYSWCCTFHF